VKCPHCGQRKGKRRCPVLVAEICPTCCAEIRAAPRRCPKSCPFFAPSETYQARRRKEKIAAHGAAYMEERTRLYSDEDELEVVGEIEHIAYLWEKSLDRLTDEEVAVAYEGLAVLRGPIAVPGQVIHPLATVIHKTLDSMPNCKKLPASRICEIARTLARLARESGGGSEPRAYLDRVASYHEHIDWHPIEFRVQPAGPGGWERIGRSNLIIPS